MAPNAIPTEGASLLADIEARSAVDYMLRTAQQNQMALTTLADQKANIVLGVTLLMVTLSGTRLSEGQIPLPLLMLLVSALVAGLFALAALFPRSSAAGHGSPVAGNKRPFNPLFFGGIAAVDLPDYLAHMAELMRTNERVYTAIITDLHSGARALRGKYQWLRYSYIALLTGLASSGATWLAQLYAGIA